MSDSVKFKMRVPRFWAFVFLGLAFALLFVGVCLVLIGSNRLTQALDADFAGQVARWGSYEGSRYASAATMHAMLGARNLTMAGAALCGAAAIPPSVFFTFWWVVSLVAWGKGE